MNGKGDVPSRIRTLVRRHGSAYASAHAVAVATPRPKIKEWPGLLATVTLARNGADDLLFCYWSSREDFERHTKAFAAIVGECELQGFLRNANEHWWTRISRYIAYNTILLT